MRFEHSCGIFIYTHKEGRRLFLILKRGRSLDVSKGHIESGESEVGAAIRETFEETGIKVIPDRFFRHNMTYVFRADGELIKKRVTMFIGELPKEEKVMLSHEHTGFLWMDFDEAMKRFRFNPHKRLLLHANLYIDRIERMSGLNARYMRLGERTGWTLSRNLVPGCGPLDAKVMIVGQAPGANEDVRRVPFVGRAGEMLNRLLKTAGLDRNRVYITSVVQFFPENNRAPTEEEVEACLPFLREQIDIVDPKLVISLGNVAMRVLTGEDRIMERHGEVLPLKLISGRETRCFVTLHPAAGVRFRKNVRLLENDFKRLKSLNKIH